jgi:hypothetical protein
MRKAQAFKILIGPAALAILALPFVWKLSGPEDRVQSTWGLEILQPIVTDQRNIDIPITKWTLDGFENDLVSNHRTSSVRRTAPDARIKATAPIAGDFHPAFILYDTRGNERVGLFVDGVQCGVAVADRDDNRERLFFLEDARNFKGGETIELRALTSEGAYRTESLLLLKDKPAHREPSYVIKDVAAQPEDTQAAITWITSWPAACTIEWSTDGSRSRSRVSEDVPANNHRLLLPNLEVGHSYRFRVSAASREGKWVSTGWQTFSTRPRPLVAGRARLERVQLVPHGGEGQLPGTWGLPFRKGELGSDLNLRLLDTNGREQALQTRMLARWEDGSAKWVLLDFQADAAKRASLVLEYGTQVTRGSPATPLRIAESQDAITIVTGPARFVIGKRRFSFLESYWLDVNRDGRFDDGEQIVSAQRPAAFYLRADDGREYTSLGAPEEVVVEESGPLRAVVRVGGEHRGPDGARLFSYTVRVHAYAGKPFLRIEHTFGNNSSANEFTSIRSLTLRLPLVKPEAGSQPGWSLGDAPNHSGVLREAQTAHLRQHTDDGYMIETSSGDTRKDRRAAGWAQWTDGSRTVTLAVRDFWENYPKDLIVSADGLELGVCPPLRKDEYAAAKGTVDEHRLYFYLQDGVYKLRQGITKTHDIWLDFQAAHQPGGTRAQASPVQSWRRTLIAVAPAAWYADTKAFGEIALPSGKGITGQYESAFGKSFEGYLENRKTNREYGMLNFGDWWGERVINWGNSEYDTQFGFFLQFARTADPRYFRTAEEVELHNRDVDTVHAHSNKSRIGGVYAHSIGHTGDYYRVSPVPNRGTPRGGLMVSHTFIEGHLYHYFLTGDRRSLETARKIADRFDLYETRNFDFSDSRNAGWHLILSMAMYNATQDVFHLNAAKIIVERVLERRTPDGGWRKLLTPGHCRCLPRHHGNAGFMLAVLLTGLKHYEEVTGDKRVEQAMIHGARFLIDDMWVPEAGGFRYTSCPVSTIMPGLNFLLFDGIVYAHKRTGDPRMREVLIQGAGRALEGMRGSGKGFTQYIRVAPHLVGYLDRIQALRAQTAGSSK